MSKTAYFIVTMFALTLGLVSCASDRDDGKVDRWVVGILPDQSESKILATYQPLMEYISKETGVDYEIRIPDSYQQMLDWFGDKTINVALFGGATFVKAYLENGAVPLVKRDVDDSFNHYLLVASDNPAITIKDLKGSRFAFGPRLSTSGHVMPRYFLRQSGIDAEKYFSEIQYSKSHDKTALMVQEGLVDVGAANSIIIRNMYQSGTLNKNKVRILSQSLPYQNYVWAVQKEIGRENIIKLRTAFLKLCCDDDKHIEILDLLDSGYYLPAAIEDFAEIESIVTNHDLD